MVRLLHLIPADADFQSRRSIEQISSKLGKQLDVQVWQFGQGASYRSPLAAGRALRHLNVDIVHAWGVAALTTAAVATPARLIYSPIGPVSGRQLRWLRAVQAYRAFECVVPSATVARGLAAGG